MKIMFVLFAVLSGIGSALQSGSNNTLQKALGTPLWTVAFVSAVTMTVAVLLPLAFGEALPSGGHLAQAPWWAWIGGLFGCGFVVATVFVSPRSGPGCSQP